MLSKQQTLKYASQAQFMKGLRLTYASDREAANALGISQTTLRKLSDKWTYPGETNRNISDRDLSSIQRGLSRIEGTERFDVADSFGSWYMSRDEKKKVVLRNVQTVEEKTRGTYVDAQGRKRNGQAGFRSEILRAGTKKTNLPRFFGYPSVRESGGRRNRRGSGKRTSKTYRGRKGR